MTGDSTLGEAIGPLDGVTVVDLSVTLPGPYCSQVLRRLGATVVHLEPPAGDSLRSVAPASHQFLSQGKASVVTDLKTADGLASALDLLAGADVVVEGWRPGVADRLGVGYDAVCALNPTVVYCSISGYGTEGEMAHRPGHDINYSAASGAFDLLRPDGLPVGDLAGAMAAATRILAELPRAQSTGHGRHIEVSIAGTLADWVDSIGGNDSRSFLTVFETPHYGVYDTRDGRRVALGIAPLEQRLWANLISALGRPDWSGLNYAERLAGREEIEAFLCETFGAMILPEIEERLAAVDTCWNVVRRPGDADGITGRMPTRPGTPPELDEHGAHYRDKGWATSPEEEGRERSIPVSQER